MPSGIVDIHDESASSSAECFSTRLTSRQRPPRCRSCSRSVALLTAVLSEVRLTSVAISARLRDRRIGWQRHRHRRLDRPGMCRSRASCRSRPRPGRNRPFVVRKSVGCIRRHHTGSGRQRRRKFAQRGKHRNSSRCHIHHQRCRTRRPRRHTTQGRTCQCRTGSECHRRHKFAQ